MTTFKNSSMTEEMRKAEKGQWEARPVYDFSTTQFMVKEKIGAPPIPAKRRYKN